MDDHNLEIYTEAAFKYSPSPNDRVQITDISTKEMIKGVRINSALIDKDKYLGFLKAMEYCSDMLTSPPSLDTFTNYKYSSSFYVTAGCTWSPANGWQGYIKTSNTVPAIVSIMNESRLKELMPKFREIAELLN